MQIFKTLTRLEECSVAFGLEEEKVIHGMGECEACEGEGGGLILGWGWSILLWREWEFWLTG